MEITIKMILSQWQLAIQRLSATVDELTNEQLKKQVANDRNTGVWILTHLIIVNENILKVTGFGEPKHEALAEQLANGKQPDTNELRTTWNETNERINAIIANVSNEKWLQKHTSVSEEDFEKDTTRNNLMIVFSRLLHMMYHAGQLGLLKTKK
ncbi:hypothetical protein CHU92_09355 [Flavobacterium cyanobacteriorum]|uniref:DinB-like domain-containing protein n=1 Tax=Flavobacterium cyanobacteriorum TaxID=2022802 RepID=A0A255Z731_9FLAO|nr:DinB family protein [Flavobacterium cyanobacteriorum]OYQ36724.1 hypothetical protein CHU92_09355 [Flavobacterium cyanobacteriorum]